MSTARADLKTVVSADTSQFSNSIRKATGEAANAGKKIGGAMTQAGDKIRKTTSNVAKLGLALAGAAASAALFKGIKGAAQIEQMGIAFEVMTGSAEKGKKMLEDIREFGAQTPYEFPALAKGAQTLLTFGLSAESVLPTMRMLGDIAAGDANKMESLSVVFGQIASTGRLMGGDLLQLINAGFNPLQEISAKTGESMIALKKRMEDGLISFAEVEGAFKAATSEGGRFFGMTDRQSKTFNGVMSTLSDSVNASLVKMSEPLMRSMIPAMERVIVLIEQMAPQFAAIGEQLVPQLKAGANFAYQLFQYFDKAGKILGATLGTLFSPEYWSAIGDMISGTFMSAAAVFQAAISTAFDSAIMGRSISEAMAHAAKEAGKSDLGKAAMDKLSGAADVLKSFEDGFSEIINKPIKTLDDWIDGLPKKIEAAVEKSDPKPITAAVTPKGSFDAFAPAGTPSMAGGDTSAPVDQFGPSFTSANTRAMRLAKESGFGTSFAGMGLGRDNPGALSGRQGVPLAGGLQTGGLGEKRRLRTSKDVKDANKAQTVQENQLTVLTEIKSGINNALTVA